MPLAAIRFTTCRDAASLLKSRKIEHALFRPTVNQLFGLPMSALEKAELRHEFNAAVEHAPTGYIPYSDDDLAIVW